MYLYLHQSVRMTNRNGGGSVKTRSELGEKLVFSALKDYCNREKLLLPALAVEEIKIRREPKGKPYFEGISPGIPPIYFSVSHTGNLWGCVMAEEQVGFDMEKLRDNINYLRIAERFFTQEECQLIRSAGLEAFFEVWVRKEAYVKYLGTGLSEGLSGFSAAAPGKMEQGSSPCVIRHCDAGIDVKAAYCCASGKIIRDTVCLKDDSGML